jgi:hypothetical protein
MAADTAKIESGSGSRQPSIGGGPTTAAATDATIKPRIAKHGYIRFLTLRNLDGRSRAVAKCNSLVASFEGDLGGRENLTTAQAQLVQRAAFLAVMCEDFEVHYTLGEPIELADYLTAINVQHRVLATLGLKRQARQVAETLSLGEYLATRDAADVEAAPSEEGGLTDDSQADAVADTATDTAEGAE